MSKIYLTPWKRDIPYPAFIRRSIPIHDDRSSYFYIYIAKISIFGWSIRLWDKTLRLHFGDEIFAFTANSAKKKCDKLLLETGKYEFISFERAEKLRLLL